MNRVAGAALIVLGLLLIVLLFQGKIADFLAALTAPNLLEVK